MIVDLYNRDTVLTQGAINNAGRGLPDTYYQSMGVQDSPFVVNEKAIESLVIFHLLTRKRVKLFEPWYGTSFWATPFNIRSTDKDVAKIVAGLTHELNSLHPYLQVKQIIPTRGINKLILHLYLSFRDKQMQFDFAMAAAK